MSLLARITIMAVGVVGVLFAVSFAVSSTTRADQVRRTVDVTGHYESNWDDVRLVQKGDRVSGTYVCCGGGTIEGRIIEGAIIKYRWKQPGGEGRGVWTIEGDRLEGTWGIEQHESDGGRWDLQRISASANIAN